MVDVFVGTERKKFHLHRDLLCDRSEYFKACFGGEFTEAKKKELHLPEDNIDGFELFVEWLYGATLKRIEDEEAVFTHIALLLLANKLCLEHLRNEIMDLIIRFYRVYPALVEPQSLSYIYEHTSDDDPLREFTVQLVAWTIIETEVTNLSIDYKKLIWLAGDFAVDLTSYLMMSSADLKIAYVNDPRSLSNCAFHKHNSTTTCSHVDYWCPDIS